MKKYLGVGLLLCAMLLVFISGNQHSQATAATTDVQAIKNGEVVYYNSVYSMLMDELNDGMTFTKKVQDYHTKKWVALETATIVKLNASTNIYFSDAEAADQFIETYRTKNNVTLNKVKLNLIQALAQAKYKKNAAAPAITLTLPDSEVTAVSKKIQVKASDENGIQDLKWAYGKQGIEYFSEHGSKISPLQNEKHQDKLIALKNGMYTVYAEDNLGNKAIKTITVDGISEFTEVAETGVHCEVCRMDLHNTDPNKVYSAKATDQEGYQHYFCRIGCMLHQEHTNGVAYKEKNVRDYHDHNWIDVENAVTVKYRADETAKGIMGWKLFHFNDVSSAADYLGVTEEKVVTEKLSNIVEYAKTNNKGMNYQYEIDQAIQ